MASKDEAANFLQKEIVRITEEKERAEITAKTVKEQMEALIQEFTDSSDADSPEKLRKNIRGRIPASLIVLDGLMATGSDAIRANIAKWFCDRGLSPEVDGLSAEAAKLNQLLENLSE